MNDHFDPFSLIAVIAIAVAFVKIFRPLAEAVGHRMRRTEVDPDPGILA